MSRLAEDLFSLFKLLILLSKSQEFLMCDSLLVPKRWDNILAKDFAMSWRADLIPFIIIHKGISGLWVLGRP